MKTPTRRTAMDAIYLDHAAATPLRPEVGEAMAPFLTGITGNPSSVHHWGRVARAALQEARERTAALLGLAPEEVLFTRGGTESANLAILGRAASFGGGTPPLFLRSTLEHSAVRESMASLAARGFRIGEIPVDPAGNAGIPQARELRDRGVGLVSCQWMNQETGTVLPIPEIAHECAEAGVPLHVDAVQAAGRIALELDRVPISLLTLSGHKLGGPRSAGLLARRRGVELGALIFGGGQEDGLRPGTEDVAAAVGLARALELALEGLAEEAPRLKALRDALQQGLQMGIPELRVFGADGPRAPHILGIGIPGLPVDLLPGALDLEGIGASAGSACRSGSTRVSPVLSALYGEEARSWAPVRLSLGWTTTEAEVERAVELIPPAVRRMWEVAGF